jgi:predicted RNA-binding protein YlxR (DUF448 family)
MYSCDFKNSLTNGKLIGILAKKIMYNFSRSSSRMEKNDVSAKSRRPQRTCVGCGAAKNKEELLRIVADRSGDLQIDRKAMLPGRGAYICGKPECAEMAKKKRGFDMSFGIKIQERAYDLLLLVITRESSAEH